MSDLVKGLLQGVVEGLTEFVPVSSTGHLILFGSAIGFDGPKADTFNVFIQAGAILAVVALYARRLPWLLESGWLKVAVATVPALLLGFLLHHQIKQYLFNPFSVAVALVVGGIALVIVERRPQTEQTELEKINLKQALYVGLFQCLALWPGISRAGSTIGGARLVGLGRLASAEFSFILAVPVILAAAGYDLLKGWKDLSLSDLPLFATGFVVAFLTALVAIRFFVRILQRYSLAVFGYYRIILGLLVLYLV